MSKNTIKVRVTMTTPSEAEEISVDLNATLIRPFTETDPLNHLITIVRWAIDTKDLSFLRANFCFQLLHYSLFLVWKGGHYTQSEALWQVSAHELLIIQWLDLLHKTGTWQILTQITHSHSSQSGIVLWHISRLQPCLASSEDCKPAFWWTVANTHAGCHTYSQNSAWIQITGQTRGFGAPWWMT